MRLKRLEITGFKSFADRGRLEFGAGITAVVGPNGCGKSNVVDAMRWCMGEMSAKHLRGRAMQDVIFAGSDSRGPLGMAEVTLTFDNDGNVAPAFAAYGEISVTRRLHRDGTSEYLINKAPVRLRDVTDLFLGTGVGTRAYSIIEQGRIGFVVNARPEERRTLIEEVAGITKFKVRKKVAERRMEATQQNLARVNDVVDELERQLAGLRRQAKRAARYKELKAELVDLDLHGAVLDYLRTGVLLQVERQQERQAEAVIAAAQQGLVADEGALEAARAGLFEREEQLQQRQQASATLDTQLAALVRDVEHMHKELREARERAEAATSEVQEARVRIVEAAREEETHAAQIEDLLSGVAQDRQGLEAAALTTQQLQEQLAQVDEELELSRRQALEHVQKVAKNRAQLTNLDAQRQTALSHLEEASVERDELTERAAAAAARREELVRRAAALTHDIATWRERSLALHQSIDKSIAEGKEAHEQLNAVQEQCSQRRSRLHSLQEIARRLEGYSDGVRTLMGADGPVLQGLLWLVTEVLQVPSQFERAIEAALGERLQYLVVDAPETAVKAIAYLQEQRGGRSGFIALANTAAAQPAAPDAAGSAALTAPWPQGAVAALDVVAVRQDCAAVAETLLGHVAVVEDLATALLLSSQPGGAGRLWATRSGEVVSSAGVLSGGSPEGAGLLANRREIRELEAVVEGLEQELAQARSRAEVLAARRAELEVESRQLEKEIHAADIARTTVHKDSEAAGSEAQRFTERLDKLRADMVRWSEELAQMDEQQSAVRAAADAAESGREEVEWRLAELQERRQIEASRLAAHNEAVTALRVQAASREERLVAARAAVERLRRAVADLQARIAKGEAFIQDGGARVVDLAESIARGQAAVTSLTGEALVQREAVSQARADYEAERNRISEAERVLREQRRGSEAVQENLLQIRMRAQRLELERQKVVEQVAERHDRNLLMVVGDYHLRDLPGAESVQRRGELDRAIKALGPINLTAIDECAAIERRYDFLVAQRDDLAGALEALQAAIQRINRTSRDRFQEAFVAVNEMFQKVFPRLFRGGEARLELVQGDDLLEAGVDIVAQPPGKKLQNVGLLSGGEKALTATALIFSIFLIKPSPFCILDEVDAPLDEANVGRFNELLREIAKISQFIVITHNKNTMTEADMLYGITMEEPGMSKVVAVDVRHLAEEQAA